MDQEEPTGNGDASQCRSPGPETRAFGLPEYSVRAMLALLFVVVGGVLLIRGQTVPDWWVATMGMILAFYFKR